MKELNDNGLCIDIISQAIDDMKAEQGNSFSLEKINLAELGRRTGVSRSRLRKLKANGFQPKPHGRIGLTSDNTVLTGYTSVLDSLLKRGVSNSSVCLKKLQDVGYSGGLTTIKVYISQHKELIPAKRQLVDSQGSRGIRYVTPPADAYQMDWGFTHVIDPNGIESTVACFAMICHHCGKCYIEFFTNAKQENLFIGMIHSFMYMGVPHYVLTDNMKSVVIKRDLDNRPIWQPDYENFMHTIGFQTKLCKPRHPFTKGKVERLIRFVKDNFLAGRHFWNISDLNEQALEWCEEQNGKYHKEINDIPDYLHSSEKTSLLPESTVILYYLFPLRQISFDGFINYEGRRFGVPFKYTGKSVRVCRKNNTLYIYTPDLKDLLVTHDVTWSRMDRYCKDQFPGAPELEEHPTAEIKTSIRQISKPEYQNAGFEKFNFMKEDEDE